MRYIARKHIDGLAILTWEYDVDYEGYSPHEADEAGTYYMVWIDVYNSEGDLIEEDGIGGVDIRFQEKTKEFEREIIEFCEWHFPGLEVTI